MVNPHISGNLRGLLERGVQVWMDAEEVKDVALEAAIGYAGSMGTCLWSDITENRAKVSLAQFFIIWTEADVGRRWCPASILGRAQDTFLCELSSLLREQEGSHPLQPRTLSILLCVSLPDVSQLASLLRVSLLDSFPFPFEMFAFVP